MCTDHKTHAQIESLIGYKLFIVEDGKLISCYDSVWGGKSKPYNQDSVNVCDSIDGFHVFVDVNLAKAAFEYARRWNYRTTYALHKVRAFDIHTLGVWGDVKTVASFQECSGMVMQCDKLEILEELASTR